MHGVGLDFDLSEWFEFDIPATKIPPHFIQSAIEENKSPEIKDNSRLYWLGKMPVMRQFIKNKKGKTLKSAELIFQNRQEKINITTDVEIGNFLMKIIPEIMIQSNKTINFSDFREEFEKSCESDFEMFKSSRTYKILSENGLVVL
jgi:hypothetical protein